MPRASDEFQRIMGNALSPPVSRAPLIDVSALEAIGRVAQERIDRETTVAAAAQYALESADASVAALMAEIETFQAGLSASEEIAVFIVGGPAGASFFPTQLRAINPDKVLFGGIDPDDHPFMLVQHVTQLNFVMRAVRVEPDEKPRRIGFHTNGNDSEG